VWFVGSFDALAYFAMESVWSPVKPMIVLLGALLDMGRRHEA
jgi:hypothetical protein